MTTIVKPIDDEARETLHDIALDCYLDGECYAFAIALSRGVGWKLVGLMSEGGTAPRHAAVYTLDHKLFDVRGPIAQDSPLFGQPFGMKPPYTLKPINEAELYRVRPIHDNSIRMAGTRAQAIWPNLPWRTSVSRVARAQAFADGLERLSRETGIWLRAPVPASKPIISEMFGEEAGYTIQYTDDGIAFTIDRRLKNRAEELEEPKLIV